MEIVQIKPCTNDVIARGSDWLIRGGVMCACDVNNGSNLRDKMHDV